MAGFLYYIPGVDPSQVSPQLLEGRGIILSFRDLFSNWQPPHNVTVAHIVHGPDGKDGCYIYPIPETGNLPRTHGYNPQEQEWKDHPANCSQNETLGYWLGVDKENRPTPPDLIRPTVVSGHEYQLGDKCEWICPVLREPSGTPNVPQAWGENGDGFVETVLAEWLWAWELSARIWNVFVGDEDMERQEAWQVCCQLLSINYRLGVHEITKLQLITSDNYVKIFQSAVEGELFIAEMKNDLDEKKNNDSMPVPANTTDGVETPRAGIDQAGLQST